MLTNNLEPIGFSEEIFHISSENKNFYDQLNTKSLAENNQILFIDSRIEDYQTLIDNLAQPAEIVILNSQQDGIFQITDSLSKYNNLNAVHIVSHGDTGKLFLGSTVLEQDTLPEYINELNNWDDFIEEDGDILLYGCDVAADLAGAEFVKDLSEYTKANIKASTDKTGSSLLGGDWDLEYATDDIEAELIFNAEVQRTYENILTGSTNNLTYLNNFIFENAGIYLPHIYPPIDRLAIDVSNLIYIDNLSFKLNTEVISFDSNRDYQSLATLDNGNFNSYLYGFTNESFNFNYDDFNFTSVSSNLNSITFGFDNKFELSKITNHSSIEFSFLDAIKLKNGTFDFAKDTINFNSMLSFDAKSVKFESNSVTFKYEPNSVKFNPSLFINNANLFDYKFLENNNFSFTAANLSFKQFNASDYRALEYAFKGDELFDSKYYLKYGVTPKGMNPFTDYIETGYKAGLNPNVLFDVNYYLNKNLDVKNAGVEPLKHYTLFGYGENNLNRDPNALFDTSYYNGNNLDVVNNGMNPLLHYLVFGNSENFDSRDPNFLFDNSYYNLNNPDVARSDMTALEHYMRFGWKESRSENSNFNPNRNPNPFVSSSDYFEINEDVRLASYKLPSANPVQHLLEFGFSENRITHELFTYEHQVKFTTVINSQSEGFAFAQNEFAKLNFKLTPLNTGGILVAQTTEPGPNPVEILIKGIAYTIYSAVTYTLSGQLFELVSEGLQYANLSFTELTLPPFPVPVPGKIDIFSSPTGETLKNITGTEGTFQTPLEPIDELSLNTESFPQRDEILEGLLDGSFIFPGTEKIPIGFYTIGDVFSASNKNIVVDLGVAREIKVATLVGGFKTVERGRPKVDLKVFNKNNPGDAIRIDVVGPNNQLILVGGAGKAGDLNKVESDSNTLKRIADSRGVQAQAYYANNTPQVVIDKAAAVLGANNVFTFPDVTTQEIPGLRDLDILTDRIDF